jgi:GDPmannose 4,6-dehydratase
MHSVREFIEVAFNLSGHRIYWEGVGDYEVGKDENGRIVIKVNKQLYRPAEVDLLLGDPSKAEKILGWKRNISFNNLVKRMIDNDIK